ncbi:MAG: helix-turn-helix domain-containing protein [Gammaproteobacteria bacterium]|nr:helix-turn-helix domain-containing protein [Gammaproteobacteria bacterium]
MAKPTYLDLDFGSRIEKVIDIIGGMSETARQTGISVPSISRWRDGTSDPSRTNIVKLAEAANVSLAWLATGDGEMKSSEESTNSNTNEGDYVSVPFYRATASAGHGAFTDGHSKPSHHLAFRKRWLEAKGFDLKHLVGLVVSGDSMEPTIHDGAAIIINMARNEVMDGNIYVIRIANRLWIKRTQWLTNGGLRLISDNKTYDNMDISATDLEHDDIEVIGQVVHTAYDLVK